MVKFITPKEEIIEYNNIFNEVDSDASPIKEILKKSNFSSFYFVKGEDEEDKISLGEVFQLQVNAKDIGVFHFLFQAEDFKKEQIVKEIATLKEINVEDSESALYKSKSLINIVKEYSPLFMVYQEDKQSRLYSSELKYLIGDSFPSFVILNKEEFEGDVKELNISPEEATPQVVDKKKQKDKITKKRLLTDLNNNKFHLSLIFVSTLLVMISTPLAVYNIYAKNYLYIFLFIFAAAGIGMNTYSYYDYFKRKDISNPVFWFSVIANFLGIGAGIGLLAIFYNISAKIENAPNLGSLILIGVLITLIIGVGTTVITYFIPKAKRKQK